MPPATKRSNCRKVTLFQYWQQGSVDSVLVGGDRSQELAFSIWTGRTGMEYGMQNLEPGIWNTEPGGLSWRRDGI